MSMTKRDFKAIAKAVATAATEADPEDAESLRLAFENLKGDLASICAQHNPNFDRTRFLDACKGEG